MGFIFSFPPCLLSFSTVPPCPAGWPVPAGEIWGGERLPGGILRGGRGGGGQVSKDHIGEVYTFMSENIIYDLGDVYILSEKIL